MPAADATLLDHEGRTVLRFERALPHPPERVWTALNEEGEQQSWHPSPFELDPAAVGGAVHFVAKAGQPNWFGDPGEVTDYDPPRVLGHTWGEDHLRWELRPHDEGCMLVLTHTFDDHFKAARDGAGWTICLDNLGSALAGVEPAGADWRALNAVYEERFGISPEDATPPPPGADVDG